MRICVAIFAAALGAVIAATAETATLDTLEITRNHGRYELYADTYLAALPQDIFEVLLEYDDDAFRRISGVYKESRYLEPQSDGTPVVYTLMEGCIMFYCLSMRRTETLETEAFSYIRTEAIPEESDFKYSMSEWTFEPEAGGTRMSYKLIMEPDFFVPPIVGPWILKRILSRGGVNVVARIERIATGEQMPRRVASRH
ncbi:MAG TPA: hypothetical protein VKQ06_03025 [Gammaproteobacteria bacterium]|nr:hypothetical protein [Gammaproteobacteria bacterium]